MAIVYQTLSTQDSGGLTITGVSGAAGQAVTITLTFYNALSAITAANNYAILLAANNTGNQTALIGGSWSNGSSIFINPAVNTWKDLPANSTITATFSESLDINEIYLFDKVSSSQAFLLKDAQVSAIRLEDGNGARDLVITDGAITDPSGFATIAFQDGDATGHFLDTSANNPPTVTLSSSSETILTGGTYTLPTVDVTDDNNSGLSHTWTASLKGFDVPLANVDTGSAGVYTFTATSDPDSGGLTGSATFTLTINSQPISDIPRDGFTIIGQSNAVGQRPGELEDFIYSTGTYPIQDRVTQLGIGYTNLIAATNALKHHGASSVWTGFWKTMAEGIAGDITMIPAASGGSEITAWEKGTTLYNYAIQSMNRFTALNAGNRHNSVIWCQGESNAGNMTTAEYKAKLIGIREDMKADTGIEDHTRWYLVGIKAPESHAAVINDALQELASEWPNAKYINTTDMTLGDQFHYDAPSLRTIGTRIATAYNSHVLVGDPTKPTITLDKYTETITVGDSWTPPVATVTDNVDTGLTANRTGTIDHTTVGNGKTYTYNVTDAAGNAADSVTYTLNVLPLSSDTTPDQFTFTDVTGVSVSSVNTSNTITVSGIDAPAAITVTGGEYQIDSGAWTSAGGTVTNGQAVTVRGTASANYLSATNVTLAIGGVSDTFSIQTESQPITGDDPVIYGQVDIVGSLRNPTTQTIAAHDGDTLKITPAVLDNDNQPLTIGSLTINVFGAAQAIGHGASVFATASSANQNNQIEVMASGPNGGQRVAAVITVNVV